MTQQLKAFSGMSRLAGMQPVDGSWEGFEDTLKWFLASSPCPVINWEILTVAHMYQSLNSLKWGCIRDYIGDYYRGY